MNDRTDIDVNPHDEIRGCTVANGSDNTFDTQRASLPKPVAVIALMLTAMLLLMRACASVVGTSCSTVDCLEQLSESCKHGCSFLLLVEKLARGPVLASWVMPFY